MDMIVTSADHGTNGREVRCNKRNNQSYCCHPSQAFRLFCKCTSVRGMSKLHTGPKALRIMWLTFVLSMTCLLVSSTALLIKDYLNYDVSVHIQVKLDTPAPFPALTVCHQPPFSFEAYELWNRSEILSPSQFNHYMRKLVLDALQRKEIDLANSIWGYDTQSVYYQNLAVKEAIQLGHSPAIFLSCVHFTAQSISFEDDCTLLRNYQLRRFSHHSFMNCYTFEPIDFTEAKDISIFSLVVGMSPRDRDVPMHPAFFIDVFEQARGLRIVVHEPGTMPDLEKDGLHVEPGKLNEIAYESYLWNRLNTPKRPCIVANESHRYRDLDEWYNYTQSSCLLQHQQREIMSECGCMLVMNPRPVEPTDTMPYCGRLRANENMTSFMERLHCLARIMEESAKNKHKGTECLPRCTYYEYASSTSITKWRGYPWQLYWLRVQNQASQNLHAYYRDHGDVNLTNHPAFKQWELYLKYDNLTHIPRHQELINLTEGTEEYFANLPKWPPENLNLDSDDFAYVVVKRKSTSTVEKNEKLVLSSYVLVSRVGGLCSLTVGLTAAFFVELLEFLYLLCNGSRATSKEKVRQEKQASSIILPDQTKDQLRGVKL
ncbi:FMRFamide-activated amiloride-sensitive sodium channel [Fasciola hepatica]|uniref:FMRFamide-activated amiloride-sensitive sodium channel n=1 Tax=Fasciola hepatica TaxID=6192 RepID=A0A4E0S096_FASHE|nr:FMRFamide-activated amiloride-sensitive sodium channel [Fasciola hepatica]